MASAEVINSSLQENNNNMDCEMTEEETTEEAMEIDKV